MACSERNRGQEVLGKLFKTGKPLLKAWPPFIGHGWP